MPASQRTAVSGPSLMRLLACLALVAVVALVGSLSTSAKISTWYAGLSKPGWTPPNLAFPIAWTILYVLMAISLWRLWESPFKGSERKCAITLFLVQLGLNAAWSPVFFGLQGILAGLAIIILLLIALAATIDSALQVDTLAGWLLVPYLLWVCYAATLNGAIAVLN
ncbi:MAG: TspO protein [Rhizobiales bacterium 32-66-8]|nr:MAG: TspO protein [Rhizobiales bacterium 32-66-8]